MRASKPLRKAVAGLFGVKPIDVPTKRLHLRVESEFGIFPTFESVAEIFASSMLAPGVMARINQPGHIDEGKLVDQLDGRIGGTDRPPWADGSGGAPEFGVCLCRVKDALYTPDFGAVITAAGVVLQSSVGEALYLTPDLAALPGVRMVDQAAIMNIPSQIRTIPKATIFMAWGGRFNYGHFVLDCLTALCVVAEEGLLDQYPAITPPLTPWHRALLKLMLGTKASKVIEVTDEVLKVDDAIYATPMDHFLHGPSTPLDKVRSQILSRLPDRTAGPERLYLSRRKDHKRLMLNELELEARLQALGFKIIYAQDFSVEDQVILFRDAKVLVGATGAAFANCLFCAPNTKVFEIQPTNYTGIWVRGLCHQVGVDWHAYFAPSPATDRSALLKVEQTAGSMFAWETPIDDFMAFLSSRLNGEA